MGLPMGVVSFSWGPFLSTAPASDISQSISPICVIKNFRFGCPSLSFAAPHIPVVQQPCCHSTVWS